MNGLDFLKKNRKYVILFGTILSLFAFHKIYVWVNTESTDDAYVSSDISIVCSEISGKVEKVFFSDDKYVKKGDIIALLEEEKYKAAYDRASFLLDSELSKLNSLEKKISIASLNLDKARESLERAKISLDLISVDFKRTEELRGESYASQKIFDDAKIKLENAKTSYAQSKLDLEIAKETSASLVEDKNSLEHYTESLKEAKKIARRDLDDTKIKAPISGILANSSLKQGSFVRSGAPIFAVTPKNRYIKANFKETQIHKLKPGMAVEIRLDSSPGKVFGGKIRSFSPATGSQFSLIPTDNATGNFTKIVQRLPVLIDFAFGEEDLIPSGSSAEVFIRTDQKIE